MFTVSDLVCVTRTGEVGFVVDLNESGTIALVNLPGFESGIHLYTHELERA